MPTPDVADRVDDTALTITTTQLRRADTYKLDYQQRISVTPGSSTESWVSTQLRQSQG